MGRVTVRLAWISVDVICVLAHYPGTANGALVGALRSEIGYHWRSDGLNARLVRLACYLYRSFELKTKNIAEHSLEILFDPAA